MHQIRTCTRTPKTLCILVNYKKCAAIKGTIDDARLLKRKSVNNRKTKCQIGKESELKGDKWRMGGTERDRVVEKTR